MNPTEILKSIERDGAADESDKAVTNIVGVNTSNVIDKSSGRPRIRPSISNKFNLVLKNPIPAIDTFEIRCFNCKKVVRFPSWYLKLEFARNVMHYFLCFDINSSDKPSLGCK